MAIKGLWVTVIQFIKSHYSIVMIHVCLFESEPTVFQIRIKLPILSVKPTEVKETGYFLHIVLSISFIPLSLQNPAIMRLPKPSLWEALTTSRLSYISRSDSQTLN